MKTERHRSGSQRLDLYPLEQRCPSCQQALVERYRKQRWVVRLDRQLKVISHCLYCPNPECRLHSVIYRPSAEAALALRGYTFGLDVVVRIGQLRYSENQSLTQIHQTLQGQIGISLKEVALLCEVFLALVNTVVQEDVELVEQLRHNGGIILAIDGIQPEKGNETLYLLRDLISGRVLVARNLASSATAEIEKLIGEVLALGVPILGVISDKQESICLAIERQLPGVPHQLCHYHYLKDLAQPVCEADRNFNKQLKQQIRQLRSVEQLAAMRSEPERSGVIRDYSVAVRQVMLQGGKYPLDPPGLKLFEHLQAIDASLERALEQHPCELLRRLHQRLSFLPEYQSRYEKLKTGFDIIHDIAKVLSTSQDESQSQQQLMALIEQQTQQFQAAQVSNLNTWVVHFAKITQAFVPKLFTYQRQPRLPCTNNALEVFIGQLKKTRRKATGRKTTQSFILREGAWVAKLLSLPNSVDWTQAFAQVNDSVFRQTLKTLRQSEARRKHWQIRRHLSDYLQALEQHWCNLQ
jgi:hypothetical protein